MGSRVIDWYRPVVAGHVPIKLVEFGKMPDAIFHPVADVHFPPRIHRAGNVNLQVPVAVLVAGFVLQLVAAVVGDGDYIEIQREVRALRAGIFNGDVAEDAVKFSHKDAGDSFGHQRRPVLIDGYAVAVIGDAPRAAVKRQRGQQNYEKGESLH